MHRQRMFEQVPKNSTRRRERIDTKLMVEKFRHKIFGKKSEKLVLKLEQMEAEEDETTQAEAEAIAERVAPTKEAKPRSERKPLPEHLKREEVTHKPDSDCCPDCGGGLRHFGDDISEQLEYVPESFKVIRHVRPKFTCTGCDRVVEAPAPCGRSSAVWQHRVFWHMIVSKYADHLPLFRQSEIYARQEWRSALDHGRMGWCSQRSAQPAERDTIQKHVLAGRKLHADDGADARTGSGQRQDQTDGSDIRAMNVQRANRPLPLSGSPIPEDRRGEHPHQHLKNFTGALQADAGRGFHHLYGNHSI